MTTKKFHQTPKPGPKLVSGEITLQSPGEIGEEIEQRGFQRYLLPIMGAVIILMIAITIYTGARQLSIQSLMFPLMFIMMGLSVMAARAGSNSKSIPEIDADRKVYRRYLTQVRNRVASSAAQQIAFWGYHGPHPTDLTALVGTPRQWSRHPNRPTPTTDNTHHKNDIRADLYLVTRVGTGTAEAEDKLLQPSDTTSDLVGPDAAPAPYLEPVQHMGLVMFLRAHSLINDCPKVTSFRTHPTVAIGGDPARAAGLLRSIICQLTLFHAPDVLQIRVRTHNPDDPEWSWLKWLPHLHHNTATSPNGALRLIYPATDNDECIRDLSARGPHKPDTAPSTGPYLIIIDLAPDTATYPKDGYLGATYIALGTTTAQYQLKVSADGALLHGSRSAAAGSRVWQPLGTADTLCAHDAGTFARRLAGWSITGAQLPESTPTAAKPDTSWPHLVQATTLNDLTPARWREYPDNAGARLSFPFGHTYGTGEPMALDIKEGSERGIGPHGVLFGTTGSGKSEFLRTLLLSAIATHHPNQLHLLLADFKGGTSFFGMKNIPHIQAIITDMEEESDLVDRFMVVLYGIINQRKDILKRATEQLGGDAISDFGVYERHRQAGADLPPVPALLVVVDEFAEMMEQHPEFINAFKKIVQTGRGLRVHLLLATQTISNVSSQYEKLKGNIDYRIALRTANTTESKAIIDTPQAAYIDRNEQGVGYLCTAPGADPIKFQAAYTGSPYQPETTTAPDTTSTQAPPPPSVPKVVAFTAATASSAAW